MFETLKPQPADKILALMAQYREDPRETKIDLGVGVYKDATGLTPVMRAIKTAEHKLWETQDSKAYTGLAGDPAYGDAMVELVLGSAVETRSGADGPGPDHRPATVLDVLHWHGRAGSLNRVAYQPVPFYRKRPTCGKRHRICCQ